MSRTLATILRRAYESQPQQTAIVLQHAGQPDRPVTYAQLLDGANAYTRALQRAGIQPGEVVVLILQHSPQLVFSFFGAVLHGAIPSIMPFLTEKLLPERYRADLASLVAITQPAAIITYAEFEPEVRAALKAGDSVRAVLVAEQVEPPCAPDFASLGGLQRGPEDIVLLQHSSGTTGLQKGVALSHRAVLNQLEDYSRALRLREDDVIVSWLPLYHDMGLIAGFLMPILWGRLLVIMSPFEWVRSPVRLLQAVTRYRGTLSWLPNFAYNFCAKKIRPRDLEGVDLSSWRGVSNCSEPMRHESHMLFLERFAPYGFRAEALWTCYAMAENTFAVTQGGVDEPPTVDEIDREAMQMRRLALPAVEGQATVKMVSAGRPIPGTEVKVVSDEGEDLPERVIGELALRGSCMLSGYYHREDATSKAFLNGWYLTGDYGYMAGGEVYVAGRKKDLIIVAGKNVYPQDLELLAMQVPGVHAGRVSAFGVFDEQAGTEEVVIVAEVDAVDPEECDQIAEGIRLAVNRGSAIALRDVYIVHAPWIVKTSSGKTARLANRDKYLKEVSERSQ